MFTFSSRINNVAAGNDKQTRVLPPPTFHDLAWSSKLIARDLKKMTQGKGTRITNKIKGICGMKKSGSEISGTGQHPSSALGKADSEDVQGTVPTSKKLKAKVPHHVKQASQSTGDTKNKDRVFSIRPDTGETRITAPESDAVPDVPLIPIPSVLEYNSLYHILSDKLEVWHQTREFALPFEQRWINRGLYLFLTIALELCPFNPAYDKFRAGQEAPDQVAFVRQLIQLGTVKGSEKILLALNLDPATRISGTPGGIYSCNGANDIRIDSAHSAISPTTWHTAGNQDGTLPKVPPSPLDLWGAILVAVTFREHSANIAEGLLRAILPDEDAHKLLLKIGDPAQRLRDGEDDEIREKLRPLLFPEYGQLFK